jgi:hypothetical protein
MQLIIKQWITRNQNIVLPLMAFFIPVIVRTLPEILIGPYIIGFDTLGFYVPNAHLWLHGGISLSGFLETAPLFYTLFMPLVAFGASPVWVIKIISPLLLGFLGLSIFAFAKKGLTWSPSKSIFVALLGTIYFVALRASWDQLREELGLIFFFTFLMLLLAKSKNNVWKRYALLSLAMLVTVLSHQLVSVLMFGILISTISYNLYRGEFGDSVRIFVSALPATLYFILVYLSFPAQSGFLNYSTNVGSPLATWTGFASYQSMLTSQGGFFLYCFLPLMPFVLIGVWRLRNLQLRTWLLMSIILLVLPLASVSPYRWVLLLTYPFAFFSTAALSWLKSVRWKRFKPKMYKAAALYLVLSTAVLSVGFIFMSSERPFFYFNPRYFNNYSYQIPTSMLQNTVSIIDCGDTVKTLQWFKNNLNNSALLLTHTVFNGWALLNLNDSQVRDYGFENPVNATLAAAQEGHKQLYLIWWTNGQGWYAQPTLPDSFQEVHHNGRIAIYFFDNTVSS